MAVDHEEAHVEAVSGGEREREEEPLWCVESRDATSCRC